MRVGGRDGVTGGKIQVDASIGENWYTLFGCGAGAKVCGLTLAGNSSTTDSSRNWSGVLLGNNGEVYNCEIYNFPDWGVCIWQGMTGWVHHNNIHHCRRQGSGYGVNTGALDIYHTCTALVEANTFDYCRHVIAGQDGLLDYIFRYNLLGANAAYEGAIDCHGNNDGGTDDLLKDGSEYIYCAGRNLQIYNNTSVCTIQNGADEFVAIRGTPHSTGLVSVHNNWLCAPGRSGANIIQWMFRIPQYGYNAPDGGTYVRMEAHDNWFGTTAPPSSDYSTSAVNQPPLTPAAPVGTTSGQVGTSCNYSVKTTDPDWDSITYGIDWNDGTSSTTGHLESGVTASVSHTWTRSGTYAVRVKATDSKGNASAWSPSLRVVIASAVTVDTVAPPVPGLLSPANGAHTGTRYPTLDWSDVTGATAVHYQLQVDNDADFSSPVISKTWITPSQYTVTRALYSRVYYWRVRAVDAAGNMSAWTASRSFAVR